MLRLLVLADHDQAARDVSYSNGRVGRVDRLAARSARAEDVDAQIVVLNVDVDLIRFRKDGDRDGRGVDAPRAFGLGHPLNPMDARFPLQRAVDVAPRDIGDDFLVAADLGVVFGSDFHFPAVGFSVASVHSKEVGGE